MIVYTSVDEPYARPIFAAFARETGVEVRPVFDTEAAKSRGLAQRILSEAQHPRADVFWSSEVMQMLSLRSGGALEPYHSPAAEGIPERYRDPDGHWVGFAGRFRVLVYRKSRPDATPPATSLLELTRPDLRGKGSMANPLFGSTMTEATALFELLGDERARAYYRSRKANDTQIVEGNSVAAERVQRGDAEVGQTDTDDAFVRLNQGVGMLFPDQKGFGALMIPNTAALVRGAPNPALARKFLDFLLRPETELLLAAGGSHQYPLHTGIAESRLPDPVRAMRKVHTMQVSYGRLIERYRDVDLFLRETFL